MQACPLNNCLAHDPNANKSSLDDFSESFSPAIKSVVDFAKGIPGFTLLNQDDQVTLLKVRERMQYQARKNFSFFDICHHVSYLLDQDKWIRNNKRCVHILANWTD